MNLWIQKNWNNIFSNLIMKLDKWGWKVTDDLLEADRILLWNDVMPDSIEIVEFVHKFKKKVITFQHGRLGSSRYYPPFNQKIISDMYCTWGESDRQKLIKAGNDPKRIVATGTPLFSNLKPRKKHEGTNVVFVPEHWDVEVPENKLVADELKRLSEKHNWHIITKVIDIHDKSRYQNTAYSDRHSLEHLEIVANILSETDIIVSLISGTMELFAQALDIPVVTYCKWEPKSCDGDDRYKKYKRNVSIGTKNIFNIELLEETILSQLANPDELREERKSVCIEEGGIDIKNPLKRMYESICK